MAGPRSRLPRRLRRRGRRHHRPAIGAALAISARPNLDLEALRLHRQCLLQVHLVALMVDQLETLEDHAERERGLVHREAAADAGALAVAERLPGIDRTLGLGLAAEILGIEDIGIGAPDAGIAMQRLTRIVVKVPFFSLYLP